MFTIHNLFVIASMTKFLHILHIFFVFVLYLLHLELFKHNKTQLMINILKKLIQYFKTKKKKTKIIMIFTENYDKNLLKKM